ncbi:MAG: hypothetical protein ACRD3J_12155 [Thermoanaerobaculia bacterium]
MRSLGLTASLAAGFASIVALPPHSPAPLPRTVLITATDYAFAVPQPALPAGWVTIRMANAGRELHMFASASVPPGYTASSLLDSLLHDRFHASLTEWGGPNAVAPGDTGSVSLFLPEGEYVMGCFVESPDGKTHFVKGMMGILHVVAAADTGSPPTSRHLVTLTTYGIAVTGVPIRPGTQMLRVRNDAKEGHDLVVLKVLPGHSVADALAWFRNLPTGRRAATTIAGTTGLHPGEQAFVNMRFTAGTYVLVCWIRTNGKYHFDLGMNRVITVPPTYTPPYPRT